jgi:hypothetical protein
MTTALCYERLMVIAMIALIITLAILALTFG